MDPETLYNLYDRFFIQLLLLLVLLPFSATQTSDSVIPNHFISSMDFSALIQRVNDLERQRSSTEEDINALNNHIRHVNELTRRFKDMENKTEKMTVELDDAVSELRNETKDIQRECNGLVFQLRNEMQEMKRDYDNKVFELENEIETMKADRTSMRDRHTTDLTRLADEMHNIKANMSVLAGKHVRDKEVFNLKLAAMETTYDKDNKTLFETIETRCENKLSTLKEVFSTNISEFADAISHLKSDVSSISTDNHRNNNTFFEKIDAAERQFQRNLESCKENLNLKYVAMNTEHVAKLTNLTDEINHIKSNFSSTGKLQARDRNSLSNMIERFQNKLKQSETNWNQNYSSLNEKYTHAFSRISNQMSLHDRELASVDHNIKSVNSVISTLSNRNSKEKCRWGYAGTDYFGWSYVTNINFMTAFSSAPSVTYGIQYLDVSVYINIRLRVRVTNISRFGFTLTLETMSPSFNNINGFWVRWMACL